MHTYGHASLYTQMTYQFIYRERINNTEDGLRRNAKILGDGATLRRKCNVMIQKQEYGERFGF